MAKLVSSNTNRGYLVDITLSLDDDVELNTYRSLLGGGLEICPHCKKKMVPAAADMQIVVKSPLTSMKSLIGSEMGYPVVTCNECHQVVQLPVTLDLAAFPSITKYLAGLRAAYANKQKKAGVKGG